MLAAVIPNPGPWRKGMGDAGTLPSNVTRSCIPWQPGYQQDPDGYIYINGQPTGQKQCLADGSAPQDSVMTVLSIPYNVFALFAQLGINATNLAKLESSAQALCNQAQATSGPNMGTDLAAIYHQSSAIKDTASGYYNACQSLWQQIQGYDQQVQGAYTMGTYKDPQTGKDIILDLQAWNHVPIAWNNIFAALECVHDTLYEYVVGWKFSDFQDVYATMQATAQKVSDSLTDVLAVVANVQSLIGQLPGGASTDVQNAVKGAQPSVDALNALATQIGSIWQQAQDQMAAARNGIDNDLQDPTAVERADNWIHDAYPPFPGAGDSAAGYAADVHNRLDSVVNSLQQYIAQNPDKVLPPGSSSSSSSSATATAGGHTLLWLGIGGAAILAAIKLKGATAAAGALL